MGLNASCSLAMHNFGTFIQSTLVETNISIQSDSYA